MADKCCFCGRPTPHLSHNYCDPEPGQEHCVIRAAKAAGGKIIAPNGLPIQCVRADNTMLEHEHADHPDYKFPVTVEYVSEVPSDLPDWDTSYYPETHALIYTDGYIAVTMYECCHAMWWLKDGSWMGGPSWEKKWRLCEADVKRLKGGW